LEHVANFLKLKLFENLVKAVPRFAMSDRGFEHQGPYNTFLVILN